MDLSPYNLVPLYTDLHNKRHSLEILPGVNICLYAPTNVGERFLKFDILGKSFDFANHQEKLFHKKGEKIFFKEQKIKIARII